MTATNTIKAYIAFVVGLLFLPLSLTLAQENNRPGSEVVIVTLSEAVGANSDATSTAVAVENTNNHWFKSEQLQGVIDQGDFVVGPGRVELEVKPGETVVYEISVANRISDGRVFDLTIEDMSGSSDGSQSVVLLGDSRGPYTIKDYISFPQDSFTLALGERAKIPVTISIPLDAEPGGYYGGVLISTVRTEGMEENPTAPRSPIIARIGTLFFVTVPGDVETSGAGKELTKVNKKLWYEKGPIRMNILFENTGSIHLNPYGEVRIHNLFGEEVGFIELEPWFVLPKSLRTREVIFDRGLLFGRYTATAYVNRGYDDIVDELTTTFWVLPWKIVGGAFLILFFILFSLRTFFKTFELKRKG
ncbi:MAG TPA: hypothetical protein PKA42_01065 [Candidatus Paceibacterota bacterium]|nr:hypothetical protein [Candidatus Paceibacterota bacterium]HMO82733.1 hypothetical protein [Candidatus Paceibacterota bacterium]